MSDLKREDPTIFLILWHAEATENAKLRTDAFQAGANMVSHSLREVETALEIMAQQTLQGHLTCSWCGLQGLTPTDLWLHQPLYHIYQPSLDGHCQACGAVVPNMAVHIHEMHDPRGPHVEIRTGSGSAVVVHRKRDNKFLMVQEFAGQGYWVPGGGNDPGESLSACAVRECKEEAGLTVRLKGLLQVMHRESPRLWRLAIYYAVPEEEDNDDDDDDEQHSSCVSQPQKPLHPPQKPKTLPNFESAGSCWVSVADLPHIPVRNNTVVDWYERVARGDFELLPMNPWPPAAQHIFADLAT